MANSLPKIIPMVVLGLSIITWVISLAFLVVYRDKYVQLVYTRIFTKFQHIQDAIENVSTIPVAIMTSSRKYKDVYPALMQNLDIYTATVQHLPSQFNISTKEIITSNVGVNMLHIAGCLAPTPKPFAIARNVTSGCACIADLYARFTIDVWNTSNQGGITIGSGDSNDNSSLTIPSVLILKNISSNVRAKYADQSISCLSERFPLITESCGDFCHVHPMAIMYYLNTITTTISLAYLLYHYSPILSSVGVFCIMAVFVASTTIPLIVIHFLSNIYLIIGCLTAFFNIHVQLRKLIDKNYNKNKKTHDKEPEHMLCFWINVQLLIPAYAMLFAITNYVHDLWGVYCFAFLGILSGYAYQRMVWFFSHTVYLNTVVNVIFTGMQFMIAFFFIYVGARYLDSTSIFTTSITSFMILTIITIIPSFMQFIKAQMNKDDTKQWGIIIDNAIYVMPVFSNILLTAVVAADTLL
jgi:hypothetical protein